MQMLKRALIGALALYGCFAVIPLAPAQTVGLVEWAIGRGAGLQLVYVRDRLGTLVPAGVLDSIQHVYGTSVDIRSYGAQCDAYSALDIVTTAGSAVVTSASANFKSSDVGKILSVSSGGNFVGGVAQPFQSTIASVQSATQATLATPVQVTLNNDNSVSYVGYRYWAFGTDDSAAFNAAITAAKSAAAARSRSASVLANIQIPSMCGLASTVALSDVNSIQFLGVAGVPEQGFRNEARFSGSGLVWLGAKDGTMISVQTPSGGQYAQVSGNGFKRLTFNCNRTAGVAVAQRSVYGSILEDVHGVECRTANFDFNVQPMATLTSAVTSGATSLTVTPNATGAVPGMAIALATANDTGWQGSVVSVSSNTITVTPPIGAGQSAPSGAAVQWGDARNNQGIRARNINCTNIWASGNCLRFDGIAIATTAMSTIDGVRMRMWKASGIVFGTSDNIHVKQVWANVASKFGDDGTTETSAYAIDFRGASGYPSLGNRVEHLIYNVHGVIARCGTSGQRHSVGNKVLEIDHFDTNDAPSVQSGCVADPITGATSASLYWSDNTGFASYGNHQFNCGEATTFSAAPASGIEANCGIKSTTAVESPTINATSQYQLSGAAALSGTLSGSNLTAVTLGGGLASNGLVNIPKPFSTTTLDTQQLLRARAGSVCPPSGTSTAITFSTPFGSSALSIAITPSGNSQVFSYTSLTTSGVTVSWPTTSTGSNACFAYTAFGK